MHIHAPNLTYINFVLSDVICDQIPDESWDGISVSQISNWAAKDIYLILICTIE